MAIIKVQCQGCGKRYSGDESKIASIAACPNCGRSDRWWEILSSASVGSNASTATDVPAPRPSARMSAAPSSSSVNTSVYAEVPLFKAEQKSRLLLIPAAVLILLSFVGTGVWWLTSDDDSPETGYSSDLTDEQQLVVDELHRELKALNSRLDVGVTFNDYVGYLLDIKVKLDAAEDACGEDPPLALTLLKRAFQDHEYAKLVWENTETWVWPRFRETLTSTYGVTEQGGRIWKEDALSAIWRKAGDRVEEAGSYMEG